MSHGGSRKTRVVQMNRNRARQVGKMKLRSVELSHIDDTPTIAEPETVAESDS